MKPAPATSPSAVLDAVAAAGRGPWLPAAYAAAAGVPRDELYDPVAVLVRAGLVEVVDWIPGTGQAFAATPAGAALAGNPTGVAAALAGDAPTPFPDPKLIPPDPTPVATTYDRGEAARAAMFGERNRRRPLVTPVLVILNVVWFAAGIGVAWHGGGSVSAYLRGQDVPTMHLLGAVTGGDLVRGQGWRLAAACFVHGGTLHLLMNAFTLASIGPVAERLWGRWRVLLIYAISGLAGCCVPVAVHPENLLVGASGAVWGLFAAVAAWLLLNRRHLPPADVADWGRSLGLSFLVNLGVSFLPGVSWEGHFTGGAVGFAVAILLNVVRPGVVRKRVSVPAAAAVAVIPFLFVAGLTVFAQSGAEWAGVRFREAAYRKAVANAEFLATTGPFARPVADELYRDCVVKVVTGRPAGDKLQARVASFQAAAAAAPATDYAAAAKDLAAALAKVLADPGRIRADALVPVAAAKQKLDRAWADAVAVPGA